MPSEKDKFSARLNEVLDDMGFAKMGHGRQTALAKLLKVPAQLAGGWLKGDSFPKTSQLVKLSQCMNVRSNWLLSGVGKKHPTERDQDKYANRKTDSVKDKKITSDAVNLDQSLLSNDAFNVALTWMKLPVSQRVALQKVIIELARKK